MVINRNIFFNAFRALTAFAILSVVLALFANYKIQSAASSYLYSDVLLIPGKKCALVLGASRFLPNGQRNLYFQYRIEAAVSLYKSGKVKFFIVSGDNSRKNYNEQQDMKDELVKRGIPESVIYMDYAGFRTLDSIVRAKEIFGQQSLIIVSQRFHNERALFIAHSLGIDAIGFNAKDVSAYIGFMTNFREVFARVKAYLDILIGVEPKFLGEKVVIE